MFKEVLAVIKRGGRTGQVLSHHMNSEEGVQILAGYVLGVGGDITQLGGGG